MLPLVRKFWYVSILASVLVQVPVSHERVRAQEAPPNVLIIITDDQRVGTLGVMPATRRWFARRGRTYRSAFATTPLCCPSRASIMTGRYAHNHRVENNTDAEDLDQATTLQHHLHEAGYRTAIAGKFLNRWNLEREPRFFHRYAIFRDGYFDTTWNVDGRIRTVRRYSTDFVGETAVRSLRSFERSADPAPWLLYVAPFAPHRPATPHRTYRHAPVSPWGGNPAVQERDLSDKPPWVRHSDVPSGVHRRIRRDQLRSLMSVDDLVRRLMRLLGALGERRSTLAFVVSDNGMYWGEHGLSGKRLPYRQAVQIPLLMRWPGHVAASSSSHRLVANIDIAPTALDAAGIPPSVIEPEPDGRTLLGGAPRRRLLIEYWVDPGANEDIPHWASTWRPNRQYVEYYRNQNDFDPFFREYYHLEDDPWQLRNRLRDDNPGNDPDLLGLHVRLQADRHCAGTSGPTACP